MKELRQCCLHHIYGGATAASYSGCPDCDDGYDYQSPFQFNGFSGNGAAVGGTIGGIIGGRYGSAAGMVVGSVLYDSVDFNKLGKNKVNSVMSELKQGYIPAD